MAVQAMNTQPVPDPAPRASKRGLGWFKVLLLLILVGGLAAGGAWYFMDQQTRSDKAALQKQIDELKAAQKVETYTNEELGFKMTIPTEWKGHYKVVEVPQQRDTLSFQLPGKDGEYMTIAAISRCSRADFDSSTDEQGLDAACPGAELATDARYAYVWLSANGASTGDELANNLGNMVEAINTFRKKVAPTFETL